MDNARTGRFALTAFLALYDTGQTVVAQALGDLLPDTVGTPDHARALRVSADVRAWQAWAEGVRGRAAMTTQFAETFN